MLFQYSVEWVPERSPIRKSLTEVSTETRAVGMDYETYRLFGLDKSARIGVNGRSRADFVATLNPPEDVHYNPCPEAYPRPGTPEGTRTEHAGWTSPPVFAGTSRDVVVYTTPGQKPGEHEQRSIEYDSMTLDDGRFLIEELIPFVVEPEGVILSNDPTQRMLVGIS